MICPLSWAIPLFHFIQESQVPVHFSLRLVRESAHGARYYVFTCSLDWSRQENEWKNRIYIAMETCCCWSDMATTIITISLTLEDTKLHFLLPRYTYKLTYVENPVGIPREKAREEKWESETVPVLIHLSSSLSFLLLSLRFTLIHNRSQSVFIPFFSILLHFSLNQLLPLLARILLRLMLNQLYFFMSAYLNKMFGEDRMNEWTSVQVKSAKEIPSFHFTCITNAAELDYTSWQKTTRFLL